VQAVELDLRARLDRLRWQLANDALAKLRTRLAALADDQPRYLSVIAGYLRECAQAIDRDELVVQCNARDLERLRSAWPQLAKEAAPNKRLTLSEDAISSVGGGVVVTSADRNIRFDNTFEGRIERLAESLQGFIAERLTPQSGEVADG